MRLELSRITHRYADLTVVSDVSLTVEDGEVVALIGPSGCGKSTLLSIAGGLLQPSEGKVYHQGEVPDNCLNPLTYVFQDFALLPWRSVEGNIRLVLNDTLLDKEQQHKRIETVLEQTGLSDFRHAFPKQLSGGMCQRVGIARALVVNPAVLLMDEPLSALDAQTRVILLEEFSLLFSQLGISALYVTHNLDEAVRLADRVVVLSRRPGKIKEIVSIPVPVDKRDENNAEMLLYREQLWQLIRDEAIAADKEELHG